MIDTKSMLKKRVPDNSASVVGNPVNANHKYLALVMLNRRLSKAEFNIGNKIPFARIVRWNFHHQFR